MTGNKVNSESLSGVLEYLGYYRQNMIVSSARYKKICKSVKDLDGNLTTQFGFETIISNKLKRTDFSIKIEKGMLPVIINSNDGRFSYYKKLSGVLEPIKSAWFEFDIKKKSEIPGIFIEHDDPGRISDIVEILIDDKEILNRIKEFIYNKKNIKYTGYFPSRKNNCIRLSRCIKNFDELKDEMEHGYGFVHKGMEILKEISACIDYFVLNTDIGERVMPDFSVELRLNEINYENMKRWDVILDILNKHGICENEKMNSLKDWVGEDWEMFHPVLTRYHTERLINHLKICFKKNCLITKAYYGFINR